MALKVCDVGAGTGYFSQQLHKHCPNIELTLIEPSPDMRAHAEQRFADTNAHLIAATLDQALPQLPAQDVFIFQRSLYALSGDMTDYHQLARQLHTQLRPQGVVAIYDFPETCDIPAFYGYMQQNAHQIGLTAEQLEEKWPAMRAAQERFNQGITDGEFLLFSAERIAEVFHAPDYALITRQPYYSFYQRV